jgi:hypothetical protein
MKRTLLLCVISALAGAWGSTWLATMPVEQELTAQEARPGMLLLPPDDELTPDERVNVNVYENANRSVVNITTKAADWIRSCFPSNRRPKEPVRVRSWTGKGTF